MARTVTVAAAQMGPVQRADSRAETLARINGMALDILGSRAGATRGRPGTTTGKTPA